MRVYVCVFVDKISQCWMVAVYLIRETHSSNNIRTHPNISESLSLYMHAVYTQSCWAAGKHSSISAMNHELCILVCSFLWINSSVNIAEVSAQRLVVSVAFCLEHSPKLNLFALSRTLSLFLSRSLCYSISEDSPGILSWWACIRTVSGTDLSQWQQLLIIKFNNKTEIKITT